MSKILNALKLKWAIEAKTEDDFYYNLKIKYWDNFKNYSHLYVPFQWTIERIRNAFNRNSDMVIDPIGALHDMYYELLYSCKDISDALVPFWIEWSEKKVYKQIKIYLCWEMRNEKDSWNTPKKLEYYKSRDNKINEIQKNDSKKEILNVIDDLLRLRSKKKFEKEVYNSKKNIFQKISYILWVTELEFVDYLKEEKSRYSLSAISKWVEKMVNDIIFSDDISIDNIKFNKARVFEV